MLVEHRRDDHLTSEFLHALTYSRDPSASMKRWLKGNSRGLQIHFGERKTLEAEGFELTSLWTRGESVAAARARLAAITPVPAPDRAPRDHMTEAFDGIDRWSRARSASLSLTWSTAKHRYEERPGSARRLPARGCRPAGGSVGTRGTERLWQEVRRSPGQEYRSRLPEPFPRTHSPRA